EDLCQALWVLPGRNYQRDGGPGIVDILRLLKASDDPFTDQLTFLKAQIAFWLLAAIDGHAKNFSVFLAPGGGFRLTPLYDVISAQPLIDKKQIRQIDLRLAMSVGDNRHYRIDTIRPRHFQQIERRAHLTVGSATDAMLQIANDLPSAIEAADAAMPAGFPRALRRSIAKGALRRCRWIRDELSR
ncbi:MAG: HipA domain-containing protein, partial [Pseudomonadota bacterium]